MVSLQCLGLVMEDEPSELSCTLIDLYVHVNLKGMIHMHMQYISVPPRKFLYNYIIKY